MVITSSHNDTFKYRQQCEVNLREIMDNLELEAVRLLTKTNIAFR